MGEVKVRWSKVPIGGLAYHPSTQTAIGEKIDEKTFRCKKKNGPGFVDFHIHPTLNEDNWELAGDTVPLE